MLDTEPIANGPNHLPIILGRPFLATANAIINCRNGVMQLTFGNMTLELNIFRLSNRHKLVENENQVTDEVCSVTKMQRNQMSINCNNWIKKMKQLVGS